MSLLKWILRVYQGLIESCYLAFQILLKLVTKNNSYMFSLKSSKILVTLDEQEDFKPSVFKLHLSVSHSWQGQNKVVTTVTLERVVFH